MPAQCPVQYYNLRRFKIKMYCCYWNVCLCCSINIRNNNRTYIPIAVYLQIIIYNLYLEIIQNNAYIENECLFDIRITIIAVYDNNDFFSRFSQTSHDGGTGSSEADGHENDAVDDGRPRRRRTSGRATGPAGLVSGRHVAGRRRTRRRRRIARGAATAARSLRPVAASGRFAHVLKAERTYRTARGGFRFSSSSRSRVLRFLSPRGTPRTNIMF